MTRSHWQVLVLLVSFVCYLYSNILSSSLDISEGPEFSRNLNLPVSLNLEINLDFIHIERCGQQDSVKGQLGISEPQHLNQFFQDFCKGHQ